MIKIKNRLENSDNVMIKNANSYVEILGNFKLFVLVRAYVFFKSYNHENQILKLFKKDMRLKYNHRETK